jgi:hypothetical protein
VGSGNTRGGFSTVLVPTPQSPIPTLTEIKTALEDTRSIIVVLGDVGIFKINRSVITDLLQLIERRYELAIRRDHDIVRCFVAFRCSFYRHGSPLAASVAASCNVRVAFPIDRS